LDGGRIWGGNLGLEGEGRSRKSTGEEKSRWVLGVEGKTPEHLVREETQRWLLRSRQESMGSRGMVRRGER